jgi:hypothetical protein
MNMRILAATGEAAKSGPIGLAVILILCVACYFLFKSMSKHMRKVREEFPGAEGAAEVPSVPGDVSHEAAATDASPVDADASIAAGDAASESANDAAEPKAAPEA